MSDSIPPRPPLYESDAENSQALWTDLQAQLRDLEFTIASLGTDDTCRKALLDLEQFEAHLRRRLEQSVDNTIARQVIRASKELAAATNADQVGQALLSFVAKTDMDLAYICLSSEGDMLTLPSASGEQTRLEWSDSWVRDGQHLSDSSHHLPLVYYALFTNFSLGNVLTVENITTDTRLDEKTRQLLESQGVGSFIALLLNSEGRHFGLFVAGRIEHSSYDSDLQGTLLSLIGQATSVLEKLHLRRELARRDQTISDSSAAAEAGQVAASQTSFPTASSTSDSASLQEQLVIRKQIEEELLKFKLGIDRSSEAVFLTDVNGTIIYVNPTFEKVYGFSQEEAIGKTPRILKSGVLSPEVYEHFWDTLLAKQVVAGEIINKAKDGRLLNIEGSTNPILDKDGELIGFLAIQRDITERKRTEASLERRAVQLQVATEVARDITTEQDLGRLLNHAVNLVRDRFGFYHAGIFLVDETGRYAVLKEATGEAGRKMLDRGHKLKVGEVGIVGYVTGSGEPRIALDVGTDAVHFQNPLLPETRSELALPLKVGEQIIGALDVQSTEEAAFDEEDVAVLQIMADQLAIAIENGRLLSETQKALQETRSLHQHYLRQEWESFLMSYTGKDDIGYALSEEGLVPAHQVWTPEIEAAVRSGQPVALTGTGDEPPLDPNRDGDGRTSPQGETMSESTGKVRSALAAPITLRGQVIGAIDLCDPDRPRVWTDDDLALIDAVTSQVALAVENARLFEQTQDALSQTEALYQVSRRIVTTTDLTDLYQVIVDELARWLRPDQCRLVIFDPEKGYGEVAAEYRLTPNAETLRIPMLGNPSYEILRDTRRPISIEDVSTHPVTAQVNDMFAELGIQSILLVPIIVRGELIGSVGLDTMGHTRQFTHTELDFCQTIAGQAAIAIDNIRAFEEQKEVAERLREVDRLKTQFLANMSHELRTPLNSIIGFSRVILKGIDGPLTEMQKTDLTAISNSGQHLLGLINNMLDLSKIEAGKMELSFEEIDLRPIIKGVMSSAIGLVKDKPIRLEQQVPDSLPLIWADSTRVRQVLLNLISNAAKFTEEGKISLTADYDVEWVTIMVTDTGIGIPEQKLETIFEEFTQVDASTTRRSGGTGLGLPISRHFVELHGGTITVKSQETVGSTFTINLPIQPQVESKTQEHGDKTKDKDEVPATDDRLVLAVDDDPGVINLYKRYLDGKGYQVIGITGDEDVIEKAEKLSPYAITLDVLMPGKDGWQLLQDLKECPQTSNIPIIVCSIVSDERRGFRLGAADYLVKPIIEDELLTALSRLHHPKAKHFGREEPEVLVIDDHADDILLIRRILEGQQGYRVIEASGGKAGIDLARQRQPDIIILDLMMPNLDGFAVLEAIKREPETSTIPIIVVTAKEMTEEERRKIESQVETLVRKGLFTSQELLDEVARLLQ